MRSDQRKPYGPQMRRPDFTELIRSDHFRGTLHIIFGRRKKAGSAYFSNSPYNIFPHPQPFAGIGIPFLLPVCLFIKRKKQPLYHRVLKKRRILIIRLIHASGKNQGHILAGGKALIHQRLLCFCSGKCLLIDRLCLSL